MRIFCKIIGVPFATVQDPAELHSLPESFKDVELVLIDTAGATTKNTASIDRLESVRTAGIPVDYHLCLSVTEKEQQMDEAIRAYSRLGIQSLIFSKLDASWSYGEIYNLSRKWALPLSFFAIGPTLADALKPNAPRARTEEEAAALLGGPVFLASEEVHIAFADDEITHVDSLDFT